MYVDALIKAVQGYARGRWCVCIWCVCCEGTGAKVSQSVPVCSAQFSCIVVIKRWDRSAGPACSGTHAWQLAVAGLLGRQPKTSGFLQHCCE